MEVHDIATAIIPVEMLDARLDDGHWNAASVSLIPARLGRPYLSAAWNSRVVIARHGTEIVGFLPVLELKSSGAPAEIFSPAGLAPGLFPDQDRPVLFVGGCTDLVSGAVVAGRLSPEDRRTVRRTLVAHAWAEAEYRELTPAALYVRDEELADFAGAGRRTALVGQLSVLRLPKDDARYLAGLTRSQRRTVLKDRGAVATAGLRTEVLPATRMTAEAARLVAAVKRRHGVADHPRLLRMRLTQWAAEPPGERLAFTVSDPSESDNYLAITLGCVTEGRLEIYETGLADDHPHRHEAYLESLIHAPVRHALAHGISEIDLGLDAEIPKTRRGAVLSPVWAIGPGRQQQVQISSDH